MNSDVVIALIPIAGILMVLGIVVAGIWGKAQARRLKAEQQMAMLARGMAIADIDRLLGHDDEANAAAKDPLRTLGTIRSTGITVSAVGLGMGLFGAVLAAIVQTRGCLVVSAVGLIPLTIGVGFLIDYALRKRELQRFGLDLGAELPEAQ